MTDKSAALFRASNLRIMDYPFEAALASALALCDEAVVVVGQSEDDTPQWVEKLAGQYPGRVAVAYTTFTFDRWWQEKWWALASSLTDAEWLVYHDADEIRHEDDIPEIKELMARDDVWLINQPYLHFYMTPNWAQKGYEHNTRIGRRSSGYRMRNWCSDENPDWPACQMVFGPNEREAHHYRGPEQEVIDAPVYHYSWCRNARALQISQMKHVDWYRDGERFGLTDGRVPDVTPWDYVGGFVDLLKDNKVCPYDGGHPSFIADWMIEHEQQWAELEAQCQHLV